MTAGAKLHTGIRRPARRGRLFGGLVTLVREAAGIFGARRAASRGAAIAFYILTSIAPVLLIVIAIAGIAFGEQAASGAIVAQFESLLGPQGADLLQRMIAGASNRSAGVAASMFGLATLTLTASGVFLELRDALNEIWETKPAGGTFSTMMRARMASLGLVMALGLLLLVSLVIDAALVAFSDIINAYLPFGAQLLMAINFAISLGLIAMLFAAIFKLLPAQPLSFRDVMFGAAVTALLFQVGKILLGLYLGSKSGDSTLGAAGAVIGLLFWIYYSAQIILFGAALTKAHYEIVHRRR
jgi:membrane protein